MNHRAQQLTGSTQHHPFQTGVPPTPNRTHLLVFLLFAGVTLAFTYPLITCMSTHFAGENIDVWLNMWANWWTRKALCEGLPFYYTTDVLYPHGVPLYFHSFSHTNTALWLLLEPWMGALAAQNTTTPVGFALLGFGIYLVVRELTGRVGAGVVAGLAATFAPYHVWECVHPNIFSTHFAPMLLLALMALFRRPSWWRGLFVGLFFALSVLSSWHQLIYVAVLIGPYLVWTLLACREKWGRDLWCALLVAALIATALVGPAIFPLLREQAGAGYAEPEIDWVFDTDLLALVTPSFLHPLWGDAVRPIYDRFPAPNRPAFVGYVVLALALLGLRRCLRGERRRVHGWILAATLLSLVLALGTKLYVNGEIVLPDFPWYGPIIGFIRTPIRLNLVLGQCLAILAGFGVAGLLGKRTGWQRPVVTGSLSALVLFEFLVCPFPTTPAYVSPFYLQLAQEPGSFAIVEAPQDRQTDKYYMYWQTVHGKPMVNGHISRRPASAFDFIQGNTLTRAFAQRLPLRARDQLGPALAELAETGIRYVVIHEQFLLAELAADWSAALATRPVYDDDDLTVFTTRPEAGVHFAVERDFDGLLLSQAWLEPGQPPVLESHWSSPERRVVTTTLRAADGSALYTQTLTVEKGSFSVLRTPLTLPDLPPGEYTLSLTSATQTFDVCRLTCDVSRLTFDTCSRLQPNVTWDETILLRGVDWHRLANTLYVDLHWEASQPPGADYKFFVHLLREDGVLAAQFDGMPRDWAYPTSLWQAGEQILDRVQIDLRPVPAGTYHLAIGWYEPDTEQRLPGVTTSGQRLPNGLLTLDRVVVIP